MEIETKKASLDTLAVTIQALHVNGKQMTLAVFRQLPVMNIYEQDGSLKSVTLWGIVRYTIKDEGQLWVVCDSGGVLYRCWFETGFDSTYRASKEADKARAWVSWWHKVKAQLDRGTESWRVDKSPSGYMGQWKEDGLPELLRDVGDCEYSLECSMRAADSQAILKNLPQLFIAI